MDNNEKNKMSENIEMPKLQNENNNIENQNSNNNNNSKTKVIMIAVITSILLVTIIGVSFAYFSAAITGNASSNNVTATTETCSLTVSYRTGNNAISLSNISAPKNGSDTTSALYFSVASTCASARNITIQLANVSNTFCQKVAAQTDTACNNTSGTINVADEIYYKIDSCSSNTDTNCATAVKDQTAAPTAATANIGTNQIPAKTTKHYKLTVGFKNKTDVTQNYNQGKTFSGRVNIVEG